MKATSEKRTPSIVNLTVKSLPHRAPAGLSSPTMATIPAPCNTTSGTRTSSTRSDTPKWRPTGSRIFGGPNNDQALDARETSGKLALVFAVVNQHWPQALLRLARGRRHVDRFATLLQLRPLRPTGKEEDAHPIAVVGPRQAPHPTHTARPQRCEAQSWAGGRVRLWIVDLGRGAPWPDVSASGKTLG